MSLDQNKEWINKSKTTRQHTHIVAWSSRFPHSFEDIKAYCSTYIKLSKLINSYSYVYSLIMLFAGCDDSLIRQVYKFISNKLSLINMDQSHSKFIYIYIYIYIFFFLTSTYGWIKSTLIYFSFLFNIDLYVDLCVGYTYSNFFFIFLGLCLSFT